MKNNIQLIVTFVLLFSLCSCTNNQSVVESTTAEESVSSSAVETVECSTTTSEEEPTQLPDYSVGMLDISLDFDELLTRYMEMYDIDPEEMESHLAEGLCYITDGFFYAPDYPSYLEDIIEISGVAYGWNCETIQMCGEMKEWEYHTIRTVAVDYFNICEYENEYWAEVSYRNYFEYRMNNNEIHNTSSVEDGYFFVFDRSYQNELCFYAYYYVDNYVISYNLNYYMPDGDPYVERYNRYLDRCEELGLPTCDEMTEIVLG